MMQKKRVRLMGLCKLQINVRFTKAGSKCLTKRQELVQSSEENPNTKSS